MTARPIDPESWRRPVYAAVALVLLLAMAIAAGCVSSPVLGNKTQLIPEDKYIFFEHHINKNGITLSGECKPPSIGYPFYFFERNSGILRVEVYEEERLYASLNKTVNESLLLFYGTGESRDGAEGFGMRTRADPVYALPLSMTDVGGNVTLDTLMADGTVHFNYNDRQLSLEPGKCWENITHVTVTRNRPEYSTNCTEEIITTDRFFNAGLIDKKTIAFNVQKRAPESVLIIASGTVKPWNASPYVHYELIMGMDQFPGFLSQWNEKMAWGLTPEQISGYSEDVNQGRVLTKYISSNQKAIGVVDIREFCKDIAEDLGFSTEQSDQFAKTAKEYYDRQKVLFY